MLELCTDETALGKRLDQWLALVLQGQFSRSQLQAFIKSGNVCVDDVCVTSAKLKLQEQQRVNITVPDPVAAQPRAQAISLDIIYEDADIIVINKPAGLVVHPGAGNYDQTLVNALLYHCGDSLSGIGGVRRPGIVHRLDKNTSGVMVVAKNDSAHQHLSAQFMDHGKEGYLQRKYLTLIWGNPDSKVGIISNYLARSNKDRTKRAVVRAEAPGAKHAVTHYRLVESFYCLESSQALLSLVECELETGRTHQIRVHMAHLGHPLLGDTEYGSGFKTKAVKLPMILGDYLTRQALHAKYLQFLHPKTLALLEFSSPLPDDMAKLLGLLRTAEDMRIINYN